MTATYLLAEVPVQITSIYDEVQQMCTPYATTMEPQILVTTTPAEIEEEGRLSDLQRQAEGLPPYQFPMPYLETLTVYRKIALSMMERGVLLMHGSVIAVDGQAYLFTALSGTGKSTHVRLWRRLFGERAVMVNDDKPLIRVAPHPIVYGTPWDGKHHLSNNIACPLRAIVFLERGQENEIHEVDARWMFPVLMQQTFRTEDPMVSMRSMQLLSVLAEHVKFYDLHCNMEPQAAQVAYDGMNQ